MSIKKEIKIGDIISEVSHYKVTSVRGSAIGVTQFETGTKDVRIGLTYMNNYCDSGVEVNNEIYVGKEDSKNGTLGIRSIFEGIYSPQVFTVCFKKQDKPKSKKQYEQEISDVIKEFSEVIDSTKSSKKGVADAAKNLVKKLVENPISTHTIGEDRVLRGYKIQFESRDGKYDCIDMDIEGIDNVRPVNINTIKWLIFNGTKYIVK